MYLQDNNIPQTATHPNGKKPLKPYNNGKHNDKEWSIIKEHLQEINSNPNTEMYKYWHEPFSMIETISGEVKCVSPYEFVIEIQKGNIAKTDGALYYDAKLYHKLEPPRPKESILFDYEEAKINPEKYKNTPYSIYTPLFDAPVEPLCASPLADSLPENYNKFSTECSRFDAGTLTVFAESDRQRNYYTRSICTIHKIVNKDANIKAKNWFDREYYSINFVASVIDTYVTGARTYYKGIDVAPKIPFYGENTQNNKVVAQYIIKQLTNKYTLNDLQEGRVEAVLYAMKLGANNDVVHPAVYRPIKENVEQNSPGAESYLKNQTDSEKKECTYFGVDFCKIGNGVKYTIYGVAGLAAIYGGIKLYGVVKTGTNLLK